MRLQLFRKPGNIQTRADARIPHLPKDNRESANSFYHSDDYDAAYAKAVSADTEEGQWEAYKECDAILAKDLPVSVILHSMNTYLFNDTNYEGLVYSCGNYVFTYLKAL